MKPIGKFYKQREKISKVFWKCEHVEYVTSICILSSSLKDRNIAGLGTVWRVFFQRLRAINKYDKTTHRWHCHWMSFNLSSRHRIETISVKNDLIWRWEWKAGFNQRQKWELNTFLIERSAVDGTGQRTSHCYSQTRSCSAHSIGNMRISRLCLHLHAIYQRVEVE